MRVHSFFIFCAIFFLFFIGYIHPCPAGSAAILEPKVNSGFQQLLSKFNASTSSKKVFKITPHPKPYALVIGIGHYQFFPDLPHAVDDAKEVAAILTSGGYEVQLLLDPASIYMKAAFDRLSDTIGKDVSRPIIVYYAGHGETQTMEENDSIGWLIPSDCPQLKKDPRSFKSKGMNTRYIETIARDIKSRHVLMLLDTSLSGDIFHIEKPALKPLGSKSRKPVRQFIIAGSADEPIPDKSLFKDHLINALLGEADTLRDGFITGSELGVFLNNRISREMDHHQTLQFATIKDPDLNQGDFIFKVIDRPVFGSLRIDAVPKYSDIKILNITPRFEQGIELNEGRYKIQVSAKGYTTHTQWIQVRSGKKTVLSIQLNKVRPVVRNHLGMDMIWIDPGQFSMGSNEKELGRFPDESLHRVVFEKGFRIQKSEVTYGQFAVFIKETGYRTDAEKGKGCWQLTENGGWKLDPILNWKSGRFNEEEKNVRHNDYPVTCVSYEDVMAFIRWLNKKEKRIYDLPTEAQWEYACRASTLSPFSFGYCLKGTDAHFAHTGFIYNSCTEVLNKGPLMPLPVRPFKPNRWGLFDMHGNVSEWCRDWYGAYQKKKVIIDPKGAKTGTERVVRGGHFANAMELLRSARRSSFSPDASARAIGFRLVLIP